MAGAVERRIEAANHTVIGIGHIEPAAVVDGKSARISQHIGADDRLDRRRFVDISAGVGCRSPGVILIWIEDRADTVIGAVGDIQNRVRLIPGQRIRRLEGGAGKVGRIAVRSVASVGRAGEGADLRRLKRGRAGDRVYGDPHLADLVGEGVRDVDIERRHLEWSVRRDVADGDRIGTHQLGFRQLKTIAFGRERAASGKHQLAVVDQQPNHAVDRVRHERISTRHGQPEWLEANRRWIPGARRARVRCQLRVSRRRRRIGLGLRADLRLRGSGRHRDEAVRGRKGEANEQRRRDRRKTAKAAEWKPRSLHRFPLAIR